MSNRARPASTSRSATSIWIRLPRARLQHRLAFGHPRLGGRHRLLPETLLCQLQVFQRQLVLVQGVLIAQVLGIPGALRNDLFRKQQVEPSFVLAGGFQRGLGVDHGQARLGDFLGTVAPGKLAELEFHPLGRGFGPGDFGRQHGLLEGRAASSALRPARAWSRAASAWATVESKASGSRRANT